MDSTSTYMNGQPIDLCDLCPCDVTKTSTPKECCVAALNGGLVKTSTEFWSEARANGVDGYTWLRILDCERSLDLVTRKFSSMTPDDYTYYDTKRLIDCIEAELFGLR